MIGYIVFGAVLLFGIVIFLLNIISQRRIKKNNLGKIVPNAVKPVVVKEKIEVESQIEEKATKEMPEIIPLMSFEKETDKNEPIKEIAKEQKIEKKEQEQSTSSDKSMNTQIKNLSPELKAILMSDVLKPKD